MADAFAGHTPVYDSARNWGQVGTCANFTNGDVLSTAMTQRPLASIWASKKPHAHSKTHIPDQTIPSTARLDHYSLQQRAKIDVSRGWQAASASLVVPYTRAPSTVHHEKPLHSWGSPDKRTKSEVATSPLPSREPKGGRNCYLTPAFSGVPRKGDKIRSGHLPCLLAG